MFLASTRLLFICGVVFSIQFQIPSICFALFAPHGQKSLGPEGSRDDIG